MDVPSKTVRAWIVGGALALLVALLLWLGAQAAPAGCTSSVGPDGEERRCAVLWLAQVHGGGV